jgi:hypothetical protein
MRWAFLATAMAVSATAGAGAAVLDVRSPHITKVNTTSDQQVCEPANFNIYFERDKARLTEPAEQMFDMIGSHVRGCSIDSLALDTPAADVASPAGRRIAGLRGAAIVKALRARGITAAALVVSQSGSANEPASITPPHLSVGLGVSKPTLSVDRAPTKNPNDA